MSASSSRWIDTRAGKLLVPIVVFILLLGGWTLYDRTRVLPGAQSGDGQCAVWFVGSSTIARWTKLEASFAPWTARNRGLNGAQVPEVLQRLRADRSDAAPGATVIYLGENDIADGIPAQDVVEGIRSVVDVVREQSPRLPIILLAMKPSPTRWTYRAEQLRFNRLARAYAGSSVNIAVVDAADTLLVGGVPGPFYVEDGVHLNDEGYRRWGGALRRQFDGILPAAQVARCNPGRKTA